MMMMAIFIGNYRTVLTGIDNVLMSIFIVIVAVVSCLS